MKQLEVQIMGQSYLLGCPEGGETRLSEAVGKVDQAMCKIRDAGKIKARDRIAVLAALNLAFELSDFSGAPSEPSSSNHNLNNLLYRLDTALGHDGHLL
jgi:cell division protein ZapA